MDVQGKRSQENGPKAENDKTERAIGLGRRTKEDIQREKWDQTVSHEIPDRGETSETPGLFCVALVFFFLFERLGDEYCSQLYVEHMLPYGSGITISLYALIVIQYFLFAIVFFYSCLYIFSSGIETPDRNGQWYQYLLPLFAMFYESNTEGTNFRMMLNFVCFT